ncbi:MAG: tetratricopeptide repeat protein [Dongiales bacterium]
MTGGLRLCRFCCALLLSAAAITPALAVNIDLNGCVSSDSKPSQRIDLCTQVIESGEYAGSKLAWAYVNRGSAYGESGQPDKAIVDFNEALRLSPNYATALADRGIAYSQQGQSERAMQDLNAALSSSPDLDWVLSSRGCVYAGLGQYQRAVQDYDAALS